MSAHLLAGFKSVPLHYDSIKPRLTFEPLAQICGVPVMQDRLAEQLWENPAVLFSCRGVSRVLQGAAKETRLLRSVRPKFLEIQGLAARALDANVSIEVSHLGAAQKIKPLAEEILQCLGALRDLDCLESDLGKKEDDEARRCSQDSAGRHLLKRLSGTGQGLAGGPDGAVVWLPSL